MSGSPIAYALTLLRSCYATSGTKIAHAANMLWYSVGYCLRACYAMSGTDLAYASSCPVLRQRRAAEVQELLGRVAEEERKAIFGTTITYGTRCEVQCMTLGAGHSVSC
eukprot:3940541-Rhodomonas_salina.3